MPRIAWYGTARWQKRRARQLAREPLCRQCKKHGKTKAATVADHIKPHRCDEYKFWNGALQSLCDRCHSSDKQHEEKSGSVRGATVDGLPLDRRHHWHQRGGGGSVS